MSDVCLAYLGGQKSEILSLRKDFGTIICGKEVTEIFELSNNKTVSVWFTVVDEDPEGDDFTISPKRLLILPGKLARFKVTFKSNVPGIVYEKKYTVSDENELVAEFRTRCISLGPSIRPRNVTLKFFLFRNSKIQTKRLELENTSTCPAKFHFERPGNNRPFQIMQEFGEIYGESKFIFDVKFAPTQLGIYCKKVYCLLQFHPPILFTLIGVYNPQKKIDPDKISFHRSTEEDTIDNYQSFMKDMNENHFTGDEDLCSELVSARTAIVKFQEGEDGSSEGDADTKGFGKMEVTRKEIPKAILSLYHLNMGSSSSLTEGIRLINTSETKEFYFEWSNENGKYFSVFPKSGTLKERQTLDLMVKFSPNLPDRLFHGVLDVRIFLITSDFDSVSPDVFTLPTTLSLGVLGHSFSNESASWLVQCDLDPAQIVLPACVPGDVVYATLMMRRFGHLPLIFEFIPPKRSRMKIKPPIGYISDSYQIFVVQFEAPTKWEGTFTESWKVAYNSTTKYYDKIPITSQVENPKLTFGQGNVVEFDTTLPGGVSKSSIPIKNSTRLKLQYEFIKMEDLSWVEIPNLTGELEPLSSAYMDIIFKPCVPMEYFDYIYCCVRSTTRQDYGITNRIELKGSCQEGFLVAIPAFHDFGKCLFGTELTRKFKVFNFTSVLMNFKLSVLSDALPEDNLKYFVNIKPSRGSILGKTNIEVEVSVTLRIADAYKFSVQCQLFSSNAKDSSPCSNPRTLFTLLVEAVLPSFRIIDLNVEGGGPLISPDWLWKMMDINGMNKTLRRVLPGEEAVMHVRLPDAAVDAPTMTIYMLIEAGVDYAVSAQIINTYRKHFARKLTLPLSQTNAHNKLTIMPPSINLEPRCRRVVNMELKYDAVGNTFYEWSLKLSLNRVLTIRTILKGLPNDETTEVSMLLEPDIELKPVFIGDLSPPVQLFWLYNNTPNETSYVLDKTFLREASQPFPRIFNCLNAHGILPPYSSLPLMLIFAPNELRQYQVRTHLCLKTDDFEALIITGNGILNSTKFSEFSHEETVAKLPLLKNCKIAVQPSVKVFTIQPFPTFSSVHRIFFLENTSEDKVWAFQWHSFRVQTLICAVVEPNEGRINPGEKIMADLMVTSFSHPSNITFSIPCDVINYTELQAYERAVHLKETIAEKCQDYFTITEKGIINEIPEVKLPEKPTKGHVFVTVRTNVVADDSIEAKLYPKDIQCMQRGIELGDFYFKRSTLNDDVTCSVNEIMERIVWNILNSQNFGRDLAEYNEQYGRATYSQIFPGSEKNVEEVQKRSLASIPTNLMQSIVQNVITDILCENFSH